MTLRLHWSPDSANLVVRIALETYGLPYEALRVRRDRDDLRTPAYLARNPQGLLPVLEDGDTVLFETGAILWHLAGKTGRLGPDGPSTDDPEARAAALKWLFYVSNTPHADLRAAFYGFRYLGHEAMPALRKGLSARIAGHCDLLESLIRDGGLVGDAVTLPDIYLCCCLRWAQVYPAPPLLSGLAPWPRLTALAKRIEALPGAVRAFEAEHIPPEHALSAARMPNLPISEIAGNR